MNCKQCGTELKPGQKFCMRCGTMIEHTQQTQPQEQPVTQPQPQAQPQQEPEKKNGLLVGGIAASSVVILFLIGLILKLTVFDNKSASQSAASGGGGGSVSSVSNNLPAQDNNQILQQDQTVSETPAVLEEQNQIEEVTVAKQLQQKLREVIRNSSDGRGKTYDVKFFWNDQNQNYGQLGVIGSIIQDVSGDGIEDLIVVRAEDDFDSVYADIYTVVNGAVTMVEEDLCLFNDGVFEDSVVVVYLKQTADGWNLIGDGVKLVQHFADGVGGGLQAYQCKGHSYQNVVSYSYAGSDLEDEYPRMMRKGQNAGLSISRAPEAELYAALDRNVRVFAGYTLTIDDEICASYDDWYELSSRGRIYGKLQVAWLTGADSQYDASAANEFLDRYGTIIYDYVDYLSDMYDEGADEYILPDSDRRKLTVADLADISDSAYLLRLARNELYARYGRMFLDDELQAYFNSKSWYVPRIEPDDFSENMLSDVEKYNRDLIKEYEDRLK